MSTQADTVIKSEIVPAGAGWNALLKRGQVLRITDIEGQQGVDFLCYAAADPAERYHAANTMKRARTLRLTTGHVLYSDIARPMMTVVGDTCGYHDTIAGCCSAQSNELIYGVRGVPGCRENFLAELKKHGLGRKDIVANLNFFCNVPVGASNALDPQVFLPGASKPGDFIALRAEIDLLAFISNCPQMNNPCTGGQPTPIRVEISTS